VPVPRAPDPDLARSIGPVAHPSEADRVQRRRGRIAVAGAIAFIVLALVGGIGYAVAWHFSNDVLVPDRSPWPEDVEVVRVGRATVTLERTEDSERPGVYGIAWQGGHAILGPIVREGGGTVTRRVRDVRGYLVPEQMLAIESDVYSGTPAARGLPYARVLVPGELGPMPAWLVPGRSREWAIVVHGINGDPQVGLRIAPTLRRAGLPQILITYREDQGAPPSRDGYHHMGLTEWRDLQAAARYALRRGARSLLLVGYSMGGALVTQFMQRSPLARRVAALVLDAPVLDWRATLEFNATRMGLPSFLADPVEWVIGARIPVDWDSLDALEHTASLHLPILLFHGTDDDVVPIATSDDLAAALPNRVTYFRVPQAGHVESWNVDPALYERRLRRFLAHLPGR
jgi:uncharacterized protein